MNKSHDWTEGPISMSDLEEMDIPCPAPRKRKYVSVDYGTMEIVINRNYEYRIDLDYCRSTGQMLDWIFHIHDKPWCDGHLIKELLDAFEELSRHFFKTNAQGPFCPNGMTQTWDWKTGVSISRKP